MARSIWSGTISFSLVNIAVTLHPATKNKSLNFHLLNKKTKNRVSYQKIDSIEGKVLSEDEIVKGYEFEKGAYIVMEETDFKAAEVRTGRSIDVISFVDYQDVDPIFFQKAYYLAPTDVGIKAYDLFVAALKEENKAGVARFVLHNKQHLGLLRAKQNTLILDTIFYNDEILRPKQIIEDHQIEADKEQLDLAKMLIKKLSGPFKPSQYKDTYRNNLTKIINEKIRGEEIVAPKSHPKKPVVDIMSALKESVERAKRAA